MPSSRFPQRDLTHRTGGPAVNAAGDGLEGAYAATLHTAPSGGVCKVVIPALSLTDYRSAFCSQAFTGSPGDMVLVTFDENKEPWVISPTGVVQPPQPTLVTSLPSLPFDGQVIDYLADATNGVVWRLRYRTASASTHKWEFVGGGSAIAGPSGSVSTASGTAVAMTGGPSVALPLAGDYEIGLYGSSTIPSPGGSVTNQTWTLLFGGAAGGSGAFLDMGNGNTFAGGSVALVQRVINQAAGTVVSVGVYSSNGATTVTFGPAELVVRPVRVG